MPIQKRPRLLAVLALAAGLLLAPASLSAPPNAPNVNGKVSGFDKISLDVYQEAAKVESRRWTWREPSPLVGAQFRSLALDPPRDVCVVALSSGGGSAMDPVAMKIVGGRIQPSTIVVSPGTKLVFKNHDPFPHKLFTASANGGWKAEVTLSNTTRQWTAPSGENTFEFRDELSPSVRGYVVVHPQAVVLTYPAKDGAFHFNLQPGEYVIQAWAGKKTTKAAQVAVKGARVVDIKDALNLAEGADAK